MDDRVRFVARLLDGEKMAVLCQEFGISRKTGGALPVRPLGVLDIPARSDQAHPPVENLLASGKSGCRRRVPGNIPGL